MKKVQFIVAFLLALFAVTLHINAVRYKVLYVNSGTVKIGGKTAEAGMVFDETDRIAWSSDRQALKVQNLSNDRVLVIAARSFQKKDSKSLANYLSRVKHLSTRGYEAQMVVADTVCYMLDSLELDAGTAVLADMTEEIVVTDGKETVVRKVLRSRDGKSYLITRDMISGRFADVVYVDVRVNDRRRCWQYDVYRRMRIEKMPLTTN